MTTDPKEPEDSFRPTIPISEGYLHKITGMNVLYLSADDIRNNHGRSIYRIRIFSTPRKEWETDPGNSKVIHALVRHLAEMDIYSLKSYVSEGECVDVTERDGKAAEAAINAIISDNRIRNRQQPAPRRR